jgi:cold shock CspA family protein
MNAPLNHHTGTIRHYNTTRGFGFVRDQAGNDYFFHVRSTVALDEAELHAGLPVQFRVGKGRDGRPCALDVAPVPA